MYGTPYALMQNVMKDTQNHDLAGQSVILIETNVAFFGKFDYIQNALTQMSAKPVSLNYAILPLKRFYQSMA